MKTMTISIRLYFFFAIALASVPVFAWVLTDAWVDTAAIKDAALQELADSATRNRTRIIHAIEQSDRYLQDLVTVARDDVFSCSPSLSPQLQTDSRLVAILLVNTEGRISCEFSKREFGPLATAGISAGLVAQELADRSSPILTPLIPLASGGYGLGIGRVLIGPSQQVEGVLLALYDLSIFSSRLFGNALPGEVISVISNEDDRMIMRWPDPSAHIGRQTASTREISTGPHKSYDIGVAFSDTSSLLGAGGSIPGTTWRIVDWRDGAVYLEPFRRRISMNMLGIGLTLFIAGAFAWCAGEIVSRPASAVARQVRANNELGGASVESYIRKLPTEIGDLVRKLVELSEFRRRSEGRLRDLLDGTGALIWEADAKTLRMKFVSGHVRALLGYEPEEITNPDFDWTCTVHREDRESTVDQAQMCLAKGEGWESKYRAIRKDGQIVWVRNICKLNATRDVIHGLAIDVSQEVRIQSALAEIDARNRSIISASPCPKLVINDKSEIEFLNQAFVATFGYVADDIPHCRDLMRQAYPEPDYRLWVFDECDRRLQLLRETKAMFQPLDVKVTAKSGKKLSCILHAGFIELKGKSHYLITLIDITERTSLADQLRQSEKMAALGQLAGGVAHDVNNDLAVIQGAAETIQEKTERGSRPNILAERILLAVSRSASLVTRMLMFARKSDEIRGCVELGSVIESATEILRQTLGSNIAVVYQGWPSPVLVKIERSELESALINLAVNARDAMPGGGTLTVRLAIADSAAGDQSFGWAELSVSDTGHGMTEDVRERIFEPFFTTKPMGSGTGLGLAGVFGFVNRSGGFIDVSTALGIGTTVTIRIPLVSSSEPVRKTITGRIDHPEPGDSKTILLVDDNDTLRSTLKEQLEDIGYNILEAGGVAQAQAIIDQCVNIDFILCDNYLGQGPTGVDLVDKLHKSGLLVPGAIITGDLSVTRGRALGAGWIYLHKPVPIKKIINAVNAATSAS